jgi:hypothetical protein
MPLTTEAHYPSNYAELLSRFPDDRSCLNYLDWLRWRDGFAYPHCVVRRSRGCSLTVAARVVGADVECWSPLAPSSIAPAHHRVHKI